jgi:hypothetical protein
VTPEAQTQGLRSSTAVTIATQKAKKFGRKGSGVLCRQNTKKLKFFKTKNSNFSWKYQSVADFLAYTRSILLEKFSARNSATIPNCDSCFALKRL